MRHGVALLGLVVACTSSRAGPGPKAAVTDSGFPTPDALAGVTQAPLPAGLPTPKVAEVEEWSLAGPFPADPSVPADTGAPWANLLAEDAKSVTTPESMACVARELGRFQLEKSAGPSQSLEAFVIGRCQASVPHAGLSSISGEVPEDVTPEKLFEQWREDVRKMIRSLPAGQRAAGIAFVRAKGKGGFFLAHGNRMAQLTAVRAVTASAATFRVEGELLIAAGSVRALINRGRFAVARCEVEPVALPAFAVTCTADPKDTSAWIEVGAYPEGRVLGKTVLTAMVWPGGKPPDTYARERRGAEVTVASAEALGVSLEGAINSVRAEAGLRPLAVEQAQGGTATKVAPYYFAASFGALPEGVLDTVALGLRAGWNVEALIRYGLFAAVSNAGSLEVGGLISSAVERPFGREVVLDPNVDRVAIGPYFSQDPPFLGAVISTYATMGDVDEEALVKQFLSRLDAARAAAGHGPTRIHAELAGDARAAGRLITGANVAPQEVLQTFMEAGAKKLRSGVSGWVLEANAIDQLKMPDELVKTTNLRASVAVGFYRPAGEPWGRYAVLVVLEAPASPNITARLDDPVPAVDRRETPEG